MLRNERPSITWTDLKYATVEREYLQELLDKARKWDRVKEIAGTYDCYPICPLVDYCVNSDIPCYLDIIVNAEVKDA
jgi:hypothetical protein